MTVKIANAFIRKIAAEKPAKVREFRDTNLRGLVVRQQPSGFISYYAITSKGSARRGSRRQRKVRIGEHPALAPSEARKAAEVIIAKAKLDDLPLAKELERLTLRRCRKTHYRGVHRMGALQCHQIPPHKTCKSYQSGSAIGGKDSVSSAMPSAQCLLPINNR